MVDRRLDTVRLQRRCRVDGIETLAAERAGRGAILLADALGQQPAAGGPACGRRLAGLHRVPPHPHDVPGILCHRPAALWHRGDPCQRGFRAYARMVDALRRNRLLFAMMDQGVENAETGVELRFLGKDMPMPAGVVQLARQSAHRILPIVTVAADPHWHFRHCPRIVLRAGGTIEEDNRWSCCATWSARPPAPATVELATAPLAQFPVAESAYCRPWPSPWWRAAPAAAATRRGGCAVVDVDRMSAITQHHSHARSRSVGQSPHGPVPVTASRA